LFYLVNKFQSVSVKGLQLSAVHDVLIFGG
jgi:hypothetical protein